MASYQVYCIECDIECSIMTFEEIKNVPSICTFCGTELDDSNVREDTVEEGDEETWNRLSEESLDELDDWKE